MNDDPAIRISDKSKKSDLKPVSGNILKFFFDTVLCFYVPQLLKLVFILRKLASSSWCQDFVLLSRWSELGQCVGFVWGGMVLFPSWTLTPGLQRTGNVFLQKHVFLQNNFENCEKTPISENWFKIPFQLTSLLPGSWVCL